MTPILRELRRSRSSAQATRIGIRERFRGRNFATLPELQQWLFQQLNQLSEQTIRSLTNWKFIRQAVRSAKKCNITRNWYDSRSFSVPVCRSGVTEQRLADRALKSLEYFFPILLAPPELKPGRVAIV